ncbi:hypothetical protein [Sulfuricurvum sp.]|uniref:hypothetical protein n=1 Tax=Sulfuricurvum sp. TaxID=2025608 RepID=UPI0035659E2F
MKTEKKERDEMLKCPKCGAWITSKGCENCGYKRGKRDEMSGHTPGKWKTVKTQVLTGWEIHVVDERGISICATNPNEPISIQQANARLIAAAPKTKQQRDDLLWAAKKLFAVSTSDYTDQDKINAWLELKAAIAKAEGKE